MVSVISTYGWQQHNFDYFQSRDCSIDYFIVVKNFCISIEIAFLVLCVVVAFLAINVIVLSNYFCWPVQEGFIGFSVVVELAWSNQIFWIIDAYIGKKAVFFSFM